jgi:hypothetical protein
MIENIVNEMHTVVFSLRI